MSRYIDIETIKPRQYENSEVELGVLAYDFDEVEAMPFLDIVWCKDCIHFDGFYCNRFGEPAEYNSPYSDDGNDFCSFGERKEI